MVILGLFQANTDVSLQASFCYSNELDWKMQQDRLSGCAASISILSSQSTSLLKRARRDVLVRVRRLQAYGVHQELQPLKVWQHS